jgi:hypothetical protein
MACCWMELFNTMNNKFAFIINNRLDKLVLVDVETSRYTILPEKIIELTKIKDIKSITMNPKDYCGIRKIGRDFLEIESDIKKLEKGYLSSINKVQLISSKIVEVNSLLIKF